MRQGALLSAVRLQLAVVAPRRSGLRLHGTRVDAGKLHDALDRYGIAHGFEVYPGNHTNKVADRFQNHVMRFFSQNLCSQDGCR